MKIVELILDENQDASGIEAISIVENPAIEEDFVALKSDEVKLAEISKDKKILMGALLIPNKPIYRNNGEDDVHDKSRKYGMNVPVGTWMGAVKVNNDEVWNDYVKTGKVKGFSIEGYFADKMERPKDSVGLSEDQEADELLSKIKEILTNE